MTAYVIGAKVGSFRRRVPSEEENSKDLWREEHQRQVAECKEDGGKTPGELTFVERFTDDDGYQCCRHLEMWAGDR